MTLTAASRQLLFSFEGFARRPYVPTKADGTVMGVSGVSLDPGLDLGQITQEQFRALSYPLPAEAIDRLALCCGLRGQTALRVLASVQDIAIPEEAAKQFFIEHMEPVWEQKTQEEFPGAVTLQLNAPDAFGGLFSLTYNRGDEWYKEHRASMLAVKQVVDDLALDERVSRVELLQLGDAVAAQAPNWPAGSVLYRRRLGEGKFIREAAILGEGT